MHAIKMKLLIFPVVHIVQAVRFRMCWLFPTAVFCGMSELVRWSTRLCSTSSISAIITGPTPLTADNFVILGYIIKTLGPRYMCIRMNCDVRYIHLKVILYDAISLTIQGIGGALTAIAAGNGKNPTTGGNVMLVGIIMQNGEFLLRYAYDQVLKPPAGDSERHQAIAYKLRMNPYMKISLYVMGFNVLDGDMVVLAIFILKSILHRVPHSPHPASLPPSGYDTIVWKGIRSLGFYLSDCAEPQGFALHLG
ncbi:hypothetical protein EDC04DRAFT_2608424 [Pisolithus marmoratus]|nr:hypothetical protein EDC04DRAFT_2608424 [Pisolithus marmoratus]